MKKMNYLFTIVLLLVMPNCNATEHSCDDHQSKEFKVDVSMIHLTDKGISYLSQNGVYRPISKIFFRDGAYYAEGGIDGIWYCRSCDTANFDTRYTCFRCSYPR